MARTIINLPLRNSVDESYNTAVNILQANGFKEVSYNGETVWKKGTGLLTAMQYIKIEFTDTTLVVSGWVQRALYLVGYKQVSVVLAETKWHLTVLLPLYQKNLL